MPSTRLPNYLRANRKRLALSQSDVVQLLGAENAAQVCRHEYFIREPSLRAVLAYVAIFKQPVDLLFAGLYEQIEQEVAKRAAILSGSASSRMSAQNTAHRHQILAKLAAKRVSKRGKQS